MSSYVYKQNGTIKAVFHYELDCTPEKELARINALPEEGNNTDCPIDTEASALI